MAGRFVVPDDLMIPLGAKATRELGKCSDNWSDSELGVLRAELPQKFHAVPLDALKMRWINIRKSCTPGYRVDGHGPSKGSRSLNRYGLSKAQMDRLEKVLCPHCYDVLSDSPVQQGDLLHFHQRSQKSERTQSSSEFALRSIQRGFM